MKISNKVFPLLLAFAFILSIHNISIAIDTITTTQTLRDGMTIVSSDGTFELGFLSPGNSKNRYVGIWYKKITDMTVVWVANREVPLTNTSRVLLKVVEPGLLVLQNDSNGVIIWSSNTSRHVKSPIAKLLDSGNLVVKDTNDDDHENFLWESFNYPTNTMFPGMKLGWASKTGHEVYLSSWKSNDDPSSGEFTYHSDPTGYPQQVEKKGSTVFYKSGPWNGLRYSGLPNLRKDPMYKYGVVLNKNEAYYYFDVLDRSIVSTFTLLASGAGQNIWVCLNSHKWYQSWCNRRKQIRNEAGQEKREEQQKISKIRTFKLDFWTNQKSIGETETGVGTCRRRRFSNTGASSQRRSTPAGKANSGAARGIDSGQGPF